MRAVAENPKFAKKVGVPQSVGKEFTMKKMMMGGMAKMTKSEKPSGMGKVKTAAPSKDGVATKGKTRGKIVKMAAGGMPMVMKDGKKVPAFAADGKGKMAKGGMTKMRYGGKC